MTENEIAREIVDSAYRIHTTLGPGLLESVYETVLVYELGRRGLRTIRQLAIPVVYQGVRIETAFRADLIVEDAVLVEIKSVETLAAVHRKQLLTYLRLTEKRLGLLINFDTALIKDGITRVVNGLEEESTTKAQGPKDNNKGHSWQVFSLRLCAFASEYFLTARPQTRASCGGRRGRRG
jgi:GxxExxY protein